MKFSEIAGHDAPISVLRDSLANGRLHHALLFTGPEGIGKRTTAMAAASFLLCRAPGKEACGLCESCKQVGAGTHADLFFVTLEATDKPTDKRKTKKNVSIDQIRETQLAIGRAAFAGGRKVVIVDEAQALSIEAQNAFLKTLEEPPPETFLILVAHSASALMPTVRSRCQRIPFAPLADPAVEAILIQAGRTIDEARRLAAYAEGSPGLALETDPAALRSAQDALLSFLELQGGFSPGQAVEAARSFSGQPEPLGLPLLLRVLRRRLREAAGAEPELTHTRKTSTLANALRAATDAYQASVALRKNANASMTLERMWMRIADTLGG